ncbi:Zinc finger protein ZAT9 [Abeliophyllum distichum]|uniref:Zinc finger protein ZAT9 n=1 Tax=Abeliophyllum distichum TaxID=126358 RepID=A0ABD1TZG0_9LAMI
MERQQCKICFKRFSNGKALGGHMRSHYATLPLPPKTPQRQELGGGTESTSSLFSFEDGDEKSIRMVDPKFLDDVGSVVIQDKESLSELTRKNNPSRISSKRAWKVYPQRVMKKKNTGKPRSSIESLAELEMVSNSVSEEEEGAWCLIMLSRDVWRSNDSVKSRTCQLSRKKYQCETCEKVFKSSQGLGSHRTSHKMIKNSFDGQKTSDCMGSTSSNFGKTFEEINFATAKFEDRIILDLNQPARPPPCCTL